MEKSLKTPRGRITGRNGHYDMVETLVQMNEHDKFTYIKGKGKSGIVLNAGLKLRTADFKELMVSCLSDDYLFDVLEKRGYALSIYAPEDIRMQAQRHGRVLTNQEIEEIIFLLNKSHEATIGINWEVIDNAIDMILRRRSPQRFTAVSCLVQYKSEPKEAFWTKIQIGEDVNYDALPYFDDDVFFYANNEEEISNMCFEHDLPGYEFFIREIDELIYPDPEIEKEARELAKLKRMFPDTSKIKSIHHETVLKDPNTNPWTTSTTDHFRVILESRADEAEIKEYAKNCIKEMQVAPIAYAVKQVARYEDGRWAIDYTQTIYHN